MMTYLYMTSDRHIIHLGILLIDIMQWTYDHDSNTFIFYLPFGQPHKQTRIIYLTVIIAHLIKSNPHPINWILWQYIRYKCMHFTCQCRISPRCAISHAANWMYCCHCGWVLKSTWILKNYKRTFACRIPRRIWHICWLPVGENRCWNICKSLWCHQS